MQALGEAVDCFVAEPVIGRASARPVGSSQWRPDRLRPRLHKKALL